MTIRRILPGVLLAVVASAGPVAAQYAAEFPATPAGRPMMPPPPTYVTAPGSGMPAGRPAAAMAGVAPTALDRVTAQTPTNGEQADPYATLTGQPNPPVTPALPPGAYPSPYYSDGPGCCSPMCRNGRIGYEIYAYTGPTWALGEGRFARQLDTGWMVGGGGRSLLFNTTHDAAWVLDLGLSYQFNLGSPQHQTDLFVHQPPTTNPFTGEQTPQPDVLSPTAIRELHRTNFNFAIGRDWWVWGPGSTGLENGWNLRFGGLVGGRWGTAHVDLLPQNTRLGEYQRRQGVTHGLFLASHATVELPMGSWILFGGMRAEWGYDWMNLVPPIQGNLHNFNLLMTAGVRF